MKLPPLPSQCNVGLVINYQGASEYRNMSWDYCPTSAKYSEQQMQAYALAVAEAVKAECFKICCHNAQHTSADEIRSLEIEL